ncbi:MAG: isoleucine--tRNA ligase [Patescibacteria group bacterium]|jgi:isoleucyl-tRNA synthetase
MALKNIDPKKPIPELEQDILDFWEKNRIFEKSLENRQDHPNFSFYDGPPFANGLPHYGHILAMTIKDTMTRFKTMEGFYVPRRGGWDTHGLPVEFELEKELGISGKNEIEKYGVARFNQKARESVMHYTKEWIKTIKRMGRWIDWENAYTTMDRDYIESVWWVFKEIYKKGLIYQGYKSLPYCPRCGTPLSNFELNQGYKDNIKDPSVFVKFKSKKNSDTYFLVWTTTPWTLPGNMALAIAKNIKYVKIKTGDEYFILAKDCLSLIDGPYDLVNELPADDLIGQEYVPLYDMNKYLPKSESGKAIYKIFIGDFVTTKDGTGIVHMAPAFGEDDLELAKKEKIAIFSTVDSNGHIIKNINIPGKGLFVKDADADIINDLRSRGLMFKSETIHHTYPFCWRCDTPLIYYATTTWFIKVSKLREQLVKNNNEIHWMPAHIKVGRFGKWLSEARDWAISRNRYWGAPIPIWQCQDCKENICIGSIDELSKLSGKDLAKIDLHKPEIDEVEVNCQCGGKAKRIPEVLDCWFESGSMPYAQNHYPFENKENFAESFPADFVAEGLDQTRGWFYTLHVLASILFDKPAFKNCIVNGTVLAADGKKLSKRLKNYEEPAIVFEKVGVDALRYFLLTSTPMGEDYRFSLENVQTDLRRVILPLWNTLSFLVTYANIDGWKPEKKTPSTNVLDRWIKSRANQTMADIKQSMDKYDLTQATRKVEDLITDLSQWYLRRSRKRADKENFYQMLYNILKSTSIMIAPFMPFLAENIWHVLREENEPVSVHLCDWPKSGEVEVKLIDDMRKIRLLAEKGRALRAASGIRTRQPLKSLTINQDLPEDLKNILKDELNVIAIETGKEIKLDTEITPELKDEGVCRDIVRLIQDLRKQAGLQPDAVAKIHFEADQDLLRLIEKSKTQIQDHTKTEIISGRIKTSEQSENLVDNKNIWLGLE